MKKIFCMLLLGALFLSLSAQDKPQERYIETYRDIAVQEMLRTGVPASITLAQGLLESGAGQSKLAVQANNHFGIKCHNGWTGRSMKLDDDRSNECFRAYDTAEESFRDHSDFLRYRDRYKFLFDLDRTDYKGWAYGLRQAGYATDPKYPAKLIKYIEDYDLARLDAIPEEEAVLLPEPPHRIEEPVVVPSARNDSESSAQEEYRFSLSRVMYSVNGVPFVYAQEGETYGSIAKYYHRFKWELLSYNDAKADESLLPGAIVYLEAKKTHTPRGLELYIVEKDGEDFHAICQRFAVREKSIMKLNGLHAPVTLHEGDEIKLR